MYSGLYRKALDKSKFAYGVIFCICFTKPASLDGKEKLDLEA